MMNPSTLTTWTRRLRNHDGDAEQIGSELAQEMRRRWSRGERLGAEEMLRDHPELGECPQAAIDVIYEEYCERESAGEENIEQDILRRFPQWAAALRVML